MTTIDLPKSCFLPDEEIKLICYALSHTFKVDGNISRQVPLPEQYADSLYFLLKKYDETNSVAGLKGTPRRRLLGNEQFRFMDEAMEANPELTSKQLHGMVTDEHH